MKLEIKVPPAGESVTEATISQILKESGSYVKTDEEILELETEKVNQVLYSPGEGLLTLTVKLDDVVKPEQVIGSIDTDAKAPAEEAPAPKKEAPPPTEAAPPKKEAPPATKAAPPPKEEGPPARKMPEEALREIAEPKAPELTPAPPPEEGVPTTRKRMSGLRKTIAKRLVAAKNQTAMLTTFNEVDMSNIMEIRSREQEGFMKRNGVKLGFMSFFVKATVAALKEFPDINSFIDGDEIVTFDSHNICIAVSTEKGLMVPVIRDCDEKSFGQIEQDIAGFAVRAREGTISIEDMRGGSFTITNGGVFGSMLSTPILNPPQSGILGMHTIVKRPVVVGNEVTIRPIMYLALSYDHRIVDGREAIQFLVHMKNNLEEPTRMLIDL
ncbi:MAG: Dihydrolipoyllysine-residue succinyltransferase component of 2-oxoglutarate dehydrogenase complex [Chlamydiae bacterium]|nr:Dihydrolipoyllysine-residue succinyltransferase component of 2-oxoglutarate dehydrogenase complex [Chlamydiota bacterium]